MTVFYGNFFLVALSVGKILLLRLQNIIHMFPER